MTSKPLLPFRSSRANRFFATVVLATAGLATACIAATLDPAKADTSSTAQTITLPSAIVVAAADPTSDPSSAPRRFRGPARDQAGQEQKTPARVLIDKKLTNDQVKDIVSGRIAMSGNANLKVGKITPKEDGIVNVDITTKTGALVETQEISTKTGLSAKAERRFAGMRERFRNHRGGNQGGPGMMAHHRGGPGGPAMARGPGQEKRDLALNADQAKKLAEARLIERGNPHLKVGAVKEKDADTISVDIVASDNSLVTQQIIDRHTGRPQRIGRT